MGFQCPFGPVKSVHSTFDQNEKTPSNLEQEASTNVNPSNERDITLLKDDLLSEDVYRNGAEAPREPGIFLRRKFAITLHQYSAIKRLVFVIFVCGLARFTTASYQWLRVNRHQELAPLVPDSVCLTPGCVLAASEIIQNISPNLHAVDPCQDFRTYVCEGWDLKHDLREDQSDLFTGTLMHEDSQLLLRHVLESPFPGTLAFEEDTTSIDEENFDKLQDAYNACLDETRLKAIGATPLLEVLLRIEDIFPANRPRQDLKSFPTMSNLHQKGLWYSGENELTNVVAYLMEIAVDSIISISIDADDRDPDFTVVSIGAPWQPGLPSKEYYKDEDVVQSYANTIGQVLEALLKEASPNSTDIATEKRRKPQLDIRNGDLVQSLINFETKLAEATPDTEDRQDVTKYYNPRTIEETRTLLPQISIQYLLSRGSPGFAPKKIIVTSPSYLKSVSKILQHTNKETVQAYLVWKTVQAYGHYVEDDAIKPLTRFNNQLQGKDPEVTEERWRTCVRHVDGGLGWILSRFYAERAFSKAAKDFGDLIVSDIKNQFIKKLSVAEWMSEDVRKLGIDKVHNIVQKIGYPTKSPDIQDPAELHAYYKSVNVSNTSYFHNSRAMAIFDVQRMWAKAGKPTDRGEWGMTVPTAYYNPAGNEIVFPAGIMQSPLFYDPSIPQYLSYGAFGSIAGHELSHAFDSSGRHYDQRGNFTGWWDNSTIQAFKEKAGCFVDQYHNYSVPGPNGEPLHINGLLTLGENIADAGGLTASFEAWQEREAAHPAQLLPGLQNFSKEKLFFMSYGNGWCGKSRKEAQINRIYTDPHSPHFARILGTMANSREFRETFECQQKEPTCEMW